MALPRYGGLQSTTPYPKITPPGGTTTTNGPTGFNVNPASHRGVSAYGAVPGSVGLPDPAADLGALYPNLTGSNAQLSKNIMSELEGDLSPETRNAIQDAAATYGVTSGMPGSQLAAFGGLRNLGRTVADTQRAGLQDYLAAITGISKTQTVAPELQTQIAQQNSVWNAAPDPEAAAKEQEALFNRYLEKTKSPAGGGGGGGGGTGIYANTLVNGWDQTSLHGQQMGAFTRNKWA